MIERAQIECNGCISIASTLHIKNIKKICPGYLFCSVFPVLFCSSDPLLLPAIVESSSYVCLYS